MLQNIWEYHKIWFKKKLDYFNKTIRFILIKLSCTNYAVHNDCICYASTISYINTLSCYYSKPGKPIKITKNYPHLCDKNVSVVNSFLTVI